jgi:arylsulfatase A-like enzyme
LKSNAPTTLVDALTGHLVESKSPCRNDRIQECTFKRTWAVTATIIVALVVTVLSLAFAFPGDAFGQIRNDRLDPTPQIPDAKSDSKVDSTSDLEPKSKPNVVLILADDLGIMDINAYAHRFTGTPAEEMFFETPNLDRLACQSMAFSQAYACHLCSPTRASLLTGKYAARTGFTTAVGGTVRTFYNQNIKPPPGYAAQDAIVWQDDIKIQQALLNGTTRDAIASRHPRDDGHDETTLAEAMVDHDAAFIGKWHVGGHGSSGWQPADNGFEEISYFDEGGSPYFNWRPTWESRTLVHPTTPQPELQRGKTGGNLGKSYLTDELTEHAVAYLHRRSHLSATDEATRPFFLYFCHFAVHTPFQGPAQDIQHFDQKLTRGFNGHDNSTYAAMLKRLDASVGRILDTLDQTGLSDNTLVVFISDNGGVMYTDPLATNNAPFKGGKGLHFEGGIRVPLMIRCKNIAPGGAWCNVPVHCTDIFPTVLELTGYRQHDRSHWMPDALSTSQAAADSTTENNFSSDSNSLRVSRTTPQAIDGRSVASLLQDPTNNDRRYQRDTFYWHYPFNVIVKSPEDGLPSAPSSAIREGDWKLIFDWSGAVRLYNIAKDPHESTDRSDQLPQRTESMFIKLNDWIDTNVAVKYTPALNPAYDPDQESRERRFVDLRRKYLGAPRAIRSAAGDPRFSLIP